VGVMGGGGGAGGRGGGGGGWGGGGGGGGERLAIEMGLPFLGSVPLDPAVRRSGDAGTPIVKSEPDSPAAKALVQVAGQALRAVRVSVGAE